MAPLKIMIITDGKTGDLMQCRGVARALTDEQNITERVVAPSFFYSLPLPFMPVQKTDRPGRPGNSTRSTSLFDLPRPDIVIASGRRTLPYLRYFNKVSGEDDRPYTVFLKDPRLHRGEIDFIWMPSHDTPRAENIYVTDTSPHTITRTALAQAAGTASLRFSKFPSPRTGVILGGNSKTVSFDQHSARELANLLSQLPLENSVLVTASRRTPSLLLEAVKDALEKHNFWIWDNEGENPYLEILASADHLLVTGDSHNMVSEALATDKPVQVYRPPGLPEKIKLFLDRLEKQGRISDISTGARPASRYNSDADFDADTNTDIENATTDIAREILRRYAQV